MNNPISDNSIARGFVFEDTPGGSGQYQVGKKGIPGVMVSNQKEVVLTDESGYFHIPAPDGCILFITKPDGYALPLNANNQPQFYYIHQPEGTPPHIALDFEGIKPTGPLPELLHFPLYKSAKQQQFSMIAMGDIQPDSMEDIGFFRDMIMPELMQQDANFIMTLGDLSWDHLNLYPALKAQLAHLPMPYFTVCGNHDINYKATSRAFATQTFRQHFGPNYYSFDYGQVHFIVLDNIGYKGWDAERQERREMVGWIDDQQLKWLENDLAQVPYEKLVVIASHIPIFTAILPQDTYRNTLNREQLFEILKYRPKLLALAAHTHFVEQVDLRKGGWEGKADFPLLITGAACGAWWKGPRDQHGLPVKLGMDGTPNGFFKLHFDGADYSFEYQGAGLPGHHQMAIHYSSYIGELNGQFGKYIIANIFGASPKAAVTCQINKDAPQTMLHQISNDPFVDSFLYENRASYPTWMKARMTSHLWCLPIEDLPEGTHQITIHATEKSGKAFKGHRLISVSKMEEADTLLSSTVLQKEI